MSIDNPQRPLGIQPDEVIVPGVTKVYLPEGGYVLRMSPDYLRNHSPHAFKAMKAAYLGVNRVLPAEYRYRNPEISKYYAGRRSDLLILGGGTGEREMGIFTPVLDNSVGNRQVNVHFLDRKILPAATEFAIEMTKKHPRIQVSFVERDLAMLSPVQPLISYLVDHTSGHNENDFRTALSIARVGHSQVFHDCPIEAVSLQGVTDYLTPVQATAVLLYVASVVMPATFVFRQVVGNLAYSHLDPAEGSAFFDSIDRARNLPEATIEVIPELKEQINRVNPIVFMNSIVQLRLTNAERTRFGLTPTYGGSHIMMDLLAALMIKYSPSLQQSDTITTENWLLPGENGDPHIASVLQTYTSL